MTQALTFDLQLLFQDFMRFQRLWIFGMVDKERLNLQVSTRIGTEGERELAYLSGLWPDSFFSAVI